MWDMAKAVCRSIVAVCIILVALVIVIFGCWGIPEGRDYLHRQQLIIAGQELLLPESERSYVAGALSRVFLEALGFIVGFGGTCTCYVLHRLNCFQVSEQGSIQLKVFIDIFFFSLPRDLF